MIGAILTMQQFEKRSKGSVGSSRIRGDWLVKNWDELEHYHIGKQYDFFIYQKAYWKSHAQSYNGIKVFDLCDPDYLEPRPVVEMIRLCDAVVLSTKTLKEQIEKFDIGDVPVHHIPDRIDFDWSKPVKEKHTGKVKSVVWFGYSSGFVALESAASALNRRGIELTVISDQNCSFADRWIKYDQDTINEEIVQHDAVILPPYPSDNYRGQFKSNNKTTQSWALRMPVITNSQELDSLMDSEKRETYAQEKYELVKREYDISLSVEQLKQIVYNIKK